MSDQQVSRHSFVFCHIHITDIRPNVQVQIRTIPSAPGPIRPVVNPAPPLPTLPTPPPSTLPPITYPRPTVGAPITTQQVLITETTTQVSRTIVSNSLSPFSIF